MFPCALALPLPPSFAATILARRYPPFTLPLVPGPESSSAQRRRRLIRSPHCVEPARSPLATSRLSSCAPEHALFREAHSNGPPPPADNLHPQALGPLGRASPRRSTRRRLVLLALPARRAAARRRRRTAALEARRSGPAAEGEGEGAWRDGGGGGGGRERPWGVRGELWQLTPLVGGGRMAWQVGAHGPG